MTTTPPLRVVAADALGYQPASIEGDTLTVHPSFRGLLSCQTLLGSQVAALSSVSEKVRKIGADLNPLAEKLAGLAALVGPLTSAAGTYREVRRRGALVYRHNAHVISDALGAVPLAYLDDLASAVLDGRKAVKLALAELNDDAPEMVRLVLLLALELLDDLAGHVEAVTLAQVLNASQVASAPQRGHKPRRSTYCAHHRRHLVVATQLDDPAPSQGFTLNAYGTARRRFSSITGGN